MNADTITVRAATLADDDGLRMLARQTPLSGAVRVTLEREPRHAEGEILALHSDTVVAERSGSLIGCGSRVLRPGWWDDRVQSVAYLTGLRVHPAHQRKVGRFLRRGFDWMVAADAVHPAAVTWTAIFSDNREALAVLPGARAGLPAYVDRGRLACRMIPTLRGVRAEGRRRGSVRLGSARDVPAMVELRHRWMMGRPLAMPLEECWLERGGSVPGLRPEDFLLWHEGGELCGMMAVWDVRSVRQVRVAKIPAWWDWIKFPVRLAAGIVGWPGLPSAGDVLAVGYTGFLTVLGDDAVAAAPLLDAARRLARRRGLDFLCLCLHEADPLAALGSRVPGVAADGRLYEVVSPGATPRWTPGIPVVEPALL
jgi:hypothetical protein